MSIPDFKNGSKKIFDCFLNYLPIKLSFSDDKHKSRRCHLCKKSRSVFNDVSFSNYPHRLKYIAICFKDTESNSVYIFKDTGTPIMKRNNGIKDANNVSNNIRHVNTTKGHVTTSMMGIK